MSDSSDAQVHLVIHDRGREFTGVVQAGESWWAAARRTTASMHADPVPLDLSAEVKQFALDHDTWMSLRAMTPGDLPDVARWLAAEHVQRWWSSDGPTNVEAVAERYGPGIDGMTPTRLWVAEANGRSIGFMQDYRVGDYPNFALLGPDPDAIGVDYVIGEPEWIGRGYGTRLLWAWMLRSRRRFPNAGAYFAAPDHRNRASLRVLARAGFTQGLWFDEPHSDGSVDTMVGCTLDVEQVLGAGTA